MFTIKHTIIAAIIFGIVSAITCETIYHTTEWLDPELNAEMVEYSIICDDEIYTYINHYQFNDQQSSAYCEYVYTLTLNY